MIIRKRYLTLTEYDPPQSNHHQKKGDYSELNEAIKHATELARGGAESVLVVSRAHAIEAYNDWRLHYHAAHDVTDSKTGFYVVLPVDDEGVLVTL